MFLIVLTLAAVVFNRQIGPSPEFGVTFSSVYAENLGLDVEETYSALLEDMGVRYIRVPVYWDEIESQNNVFDWEELDRLMQMSEQYEARVTLVIGQKVPRWPECFVPDWAEHLDTDRAHQELLAFMEQVVLRYQNSPALFRWQIENEAFFPFGICPKPNVAQFAEEIDLVRSLDTHPIQLTVSGELEPYIDAAVSADVLGISLYRVTWNKVIGYFYYPISPAFYRMKIASIHGLVDGVVISELQAEPWFPEAISKRSASEWAGAFGPKDLLRNVDFAKRVGVDEVYLWGAEWWYFLKLHNEDALWESAKGVFESVL